MIARLRNLLDKASARIEEAASAWWDATLRAPLTLSTMGSTLRGVALVKEHWDRSLEQSWATWRLPSAGDLERLYQQVAELQGQLDRMEDQLGEGAQS